MTTTIYVVESVDGEYDERSELPICAFVSEEKAEECVQKLNELDKFNTEFSKRIKPEFDEPYDLNNSPLPEPPTYPELPPYFHIIEQEVAASRGRAISFIKDKYKELQSIHLKNVEFYKKLEALYREELNKFSSRKDEARKAWFQENYIIPEHLKEVAQYVYYDGGYSYYTTKYSYYRITLHT